MLISRQRATYSDIVFTQELRTKDVILVNYISVAFTVSVWTESGAQLSGETCTIDSRTPFY